MTDEQEHRIIYLEPCGESGEDRQWCHDDAWGACEECGRKSVKYIISTEYDALVKALKQIAGLGEDDDDPEYEIARQALALVQENASE